MTTLAGLAQALPGITVRSLFFHVHEARRRRKDGSDDFSAWLEQIGAEPALVAGLRAVDFYFLNLNQLRQEFIDVFRSHLPDPSVLLKVTA